MPALPKSASLSAAMKCCHEVRCVHVRGCRAGNQSLKVLYKLSWGRCWKCLPPSCKSVNCKKYCEGANRSSTVSLSNMVIVIIFSIVSLCQVLPWDKCTAQVFPRVTLCHQGRHADCCRPAGRCSTWESGNVMPCVKTAKAKICTLRSWERRSVFAPAVCVHILSHNSFMHIAQMAN